MELTRIGIALALAASLQGPSLNGQWLTYPTPGIPRLTNGKPDFAAPTPKTADGKPDLSGLWNRISPKYRVNIAADLKPEDVQPWARAITAQRVEDLGRGAMNAQCLPSGPAYATDSDSTSGGQMKIIQTPREVVILNTDLTYREIFMDGRTLETAPNPAWMGYSVGHWEGETLVVESSGYNDRTWLDTSGHPHTEGLQVTERYRRRNFGNLELEITYRDPGAYTRPWTVAVRAELAADTGLIEYVCNEERSDMAHWVGKASDEAKSEVRVPGAVLAHYTGKYVEQPPLWRIVPRVVEIVLKDGVLYGDLDGRGPERQYASSETSFSGFSGLGIEFGRDSSGAVTGLRIKHVSGDYRLLRQSE